MYEFYLIRPDLISNTDIYSNIILDQTKTYYGAKPKVGNNTDYPNWWTEKTIENVAFFQLEVGGTIDFSEGQEMKTTLGPMNISFQFGLEKEMPRTLSLTDIFVGNTSEESTKYFLRALSYAKTKWSKKTGKLACLYVYDTNTSAECQSFYQWNGTTWAAWKGGIKEFRTHIDLNMNVFIDQIALEGAWG